MEKRRAFTLMELLVVVAIITVLGALLMPSLAKARDSSRRAACLSNLHQYLTVSTAYELDSRGILPMGFVEDQKQSNYHAYHRSWGWMMMGLLVRHGLVENGQAMYCPAETDAQWQYDTKTNPWRAKRFNAADPRFAGQHTRMGYGVRPVLAWELDNPPVPHAFNDTTNAMVMPAQKWVRMEDYAKRAILADIVSMDDSIRERHRDGVNVSFGDGSTAWVGDRSFRPLVAGIADTGFNKTHNAAMLRYDGTPNAQGVWTRLDAR